MQDMEVNGVLNLNNINGYYFKKRQIIQYGFYFVGRVFEFPKHYGRKLIQYLST